MPIRVTVWHEYRHEKKHEIIRKIYPEGIHMVLKAAIEEHLGKDVIVRTATLDEPEHGIPDEVLNNTDVLTWWGHQAHDEVQEAIANKVARRVREGMGLIVLHSGHYSRPFKQLMGTTGNLLWREAGEKERIWCVCPGHPITAGLTNNYIELEHEEMYGEPFDIPEPDELVFISWFEGGEVFRSGAVWRRGAGRVFYFRPGHERFPTYYDKDIRRVIANGVRYCAPSDGFRPPLETAINIKTPLSPITTVHEVDESIHGKS